MNGRFYLFGAIISLALHGAFFSLLTVGSCKANPPATAVPPTEAPVEAETNAATIVATRVTDPFSEDAPPPPISKAVQKTVQKPVELVRVRDLAPPLNDPAPTETEREWKTYVVKKGDTLTILARKAGCSVAEIAKRNNKTVAQMAKLWVGQKIKLPTE